MPERKENLNYYCVNIKIQSKPKPVATDYAELILQIFKDDVYFNYSSDKALAFRNQFAGQTRHKGNEYQYFYGKIVRFTLLDGDNWYSKGKRDYVTIEIPKETYPNAVESDYIFIPAIHRFLLKKGKLGIKNVAEFLQKSFELVAQEGQTIKTVIENSEDIIDKILTSPALLSLDVTLSYTNDDIGDEAKELMDDLMKEGDIGQFSAQLRPDGAQQLDTNSRFIRGIVELAKENGSVEASILNDNGKRQKVITQAHPEVTTIISENKDDIWKDAVVHFLKKYPRRDEQ